MNSLLLGVDIGASNIKIVELKEKGSGFAVKNVILAETPPRTFVDGSVLNSEAVAKSLGDALKTGKGVQKEAALALHGDDVIVKRLDIPWNGQGSFQELFLWSAEQYMGMNCDDATFDAQLLRYDIENQTADTVIAAALKNKVEDLLGTASGSGLHPMVVDIESLALVNLMTSIKGTSKHVNTILDMGHDSVRVIFYENGHVDMVKTIHKGGKFLISEMAQDMDTDQEKAESVMRDKEAMNADSGAKASAMGYGRNLGSELETVIDGYMQERGKEPVDFYACGAVAYVAEVLENVEGTLGVAINHIDPFRQIELPDAFRETVDGCGAGTFAVAAGLAMRRA